MNALLAELAAGLPLTGDIARDAAALFASHQCRHTTGHSARVAAAARGLAERCGADPWAAATAGWLHDISTVIPNAERIGYAEAWGLVVLPEERQVPMIVHQKLSAYMARHLFEVADEAVLRAIECHTTLRAGASTMDKVVFIADKLKWDGEGDPPYLAGLEAALEQSVEAAAAWFVAYLWERRDTLLVIHPWLADAYRDVSGEEPAR
jgi:predicted HD superfamily hydrolase involved in NAD metabolism